LVLETFSFKLLLKVPGISALNVEFSVRFGWTYYEKCKIMVWAVRYVHSNVASFFFIFVYLHVARGIYYGSFKSPRVLVWSIGCIILILLMAIAFLGYVFTLSVKWVFEVILIALNVYYLSLL